LLAGHVHVGRRAFLSGGVMVHQFCRIGTMAMVHGGERITQDVPPFAMMAEGGIRGPNTVGLRRAGIAPEARKAIKQAMRIYFAPGANRSLALEEIRRTLGGIPEVALFVDFAEVTKRGLVPGRGRPLEE
jgi:UDP-N-acetylglucosamine acyltransferase